VQKTNAFVTAAKIGAGEVAVIAVGVHASGELLGRIVELRVVPRPVSTSRA
jgi:hypothetical protein